MNPQPALHIFTDHGLRPATALPVINNAQELIWPSIFLFLCLALLALIKASAFGQVIRIVNSTFSNQILQQLEREEANSYKLHSLGLSAFFILNLGFLAYKLNSLYGWILVKSSDLAQFIFFLALISLIYGGKLLAVRLVAFFSDKRRLFGDYTTSTTLINQTFGLFIFPFLVLSEFTDWNPRYLLWSAMVILAISVLIKWYRGLSMSLVEERIGLLQIISYFCGLEILPLLALVKVVVENL